MPILYHGINGRALYRAAKVSHLFCPVTIFFHVEKASRGFSKKVDSIICIQILSIARTFSLELFCLRKIFYIFGRVPI